MCKATVRGFGSARRLPSFGLCKLFKFAVLYNNALPSYGQQPFLDGCHTSVLIAVQCEGGKFPALNCRCVRGFGVLIVALVQT